MPQSALCRLVAATLSCLGLMCASPRAQESQPEPVTNGPAVNYGTAATQAAAATLIEITDSALIARAWETLFPDSSAPAGEYQALIPDGPELSSGREASASVYVLRNGTEVGRIDRAAWDALTSMSRQEGGWAAALEGPEKQEVPIFWKALDWHPASILGWAEWPYGFAFAMGSTISSVPTSKPQYRRDIDFGWDQKLFSHFLLGASLHRSQFGGGLTRLGEEVADTAGGQPASFSSRDFWGDGFWWWSLSAGVPGVKYTLSLASQPMPQYFWLETRASEAIRAHKSGRMVSQWTGKQLQIEGNLAHTLDLRLGKFRYGLHWDSDAYNFPVQTLGCEDLPALFGSWGLGLVMASDLMATRVWVDIPDAALRLDFPEQWPTNFRVAFLHFEFEYRNPKSFNIGISVRLHIDNPIMNRPGA